MNVPAVLVKIYRLLHRYNPFRAEVGLFPIGEPGRDAPVLVSGNYADTTDRLFEAARAAGVPCWLLIADSAGINVWCAAGVGDFNEVKICDAIAATGLAKQVDHRRLIVSPLAAVGIDRKRLRELTGGFDVVWGPAHLNDLPAFLRGGARPLPDMHLTRFPARDRLEQAIGVLGVFSFPLLLAWWWPRPVLWFMGSLAHAIFGSFAGYFALPPRHPANKTLLLAGLQAAAVAFIHHRWPRARWTRAMPLWARLALGLAAHLLIAIDMIGSTPFYKSTIGHWLTTGDNTALFQPDLNARCVSCGRCLEVCPKGLFSRLPPGTQPAAMPANAGEPAPAAPARRAHPAGIVVVDRGRECCECLACVKQCPHHAIDNVGSGYKDDIKTLPPATVERLRQPRPA